MENFPTKTAAAAHYKYYNARHGLPILSCYLYEAFFLSVQTFWVKMNEVQVQLLALFFLVKITSSPLSTFFYFSWFFNFFFGTSKRSKLSFLIPFPLCHNVRNQNTAYNLTYPTHVTELIVSPRFVFKTSLHTLKLNLHRLETVCPQAHTYLSVDIHIHFYWLLLWNKMTLRTFWCYGTLHSRHRTQKSKVKGSQVR